MLLLSQKISAQSNSDIKENKRKVRKEKVHYYSGTEHIKKKKRKVITFDRTSLIYDAGQTTLEGLKEINNRQRKQRNKH